MGADRLRFVMLVALAWFVVAVVASGPDPDRSTWLGTSSLDTVLLIALLVGAAIAAVLLIVLRPAGPGEGPPPRRRRTSTLYVMLALALVLLIWRPDLLELLREGAESVDSEVSEQGPELTPEPDVATDREPVAELGDLIGLAALAAVVGGVVWLLNRPAIEAVAATPECDIEPLAPVDALGDAVELARERIASTSDPRDAVIAAYATLEQALATNGLPRERAETAEEHLVRATSALGADPSPFAELGRLYSLARFSDRPISVQVRTDATDALHRATHALGVE